MGFKSTIRGEQVTDESIESVDLASGSIKAGEIHEEAISGQPTITGADIHVSNDRFLIWDADGSTSGTLKQVSTQALRNGGIVFNENSADVDFRVESNGSTHMIFVNGSNDRVGIGTDSPSTTFHAYADASNAYIATIDNDASSAGHVLKLATDGNGSGTHILEMEDGDGDIVFRARADGRFGFGPDGVGSMGAGTFVVGIDNSSHTSDIAISQRLQHLGDGDTYIDFPANDQLQFQVGGVDMIHMTEDGTQDKIVFNDGAADVDFIVKSPNESKAIYLNAANEVLHINHGESNFQTKIL